MSDEPQYLVVRNDAKQYSLWPAGRDLPLGWFPAGTTGSREQCLAEIERVWTI